MEITITCGEGSADASSLHRWLMAERTLRGHAVVSVRPAVQEQGQMGGALDVVNVVLSNGIALGSLITAVLTWRSSRPRPPRLTLERDGSLVTLYDGSPELVERILREWNAAGGPDATTDPPAAAPLDPPAVNADGE
ncbi:hypothetical protein ABZ471_03670 [Streptomyces sp. NPDC005728]|uniref:effector-associated constant component EACC1 n=1 Tax=Streptomyces sp. NPDC005728 TaxID=3157054 RepID=UPI0033D44EB0